MPYEKNGKRKRRSNVSKSMLQYHEDMKKVRIEKPEIENCDLFLSTSPEISWQDGRRIVELDVLANSLRSCKMCTIPLQLHNTEGEKRQGLGSYLSVRCAECNFINTIQTNKTHVNGSRGPGVFDINTKTAIGLTDSGLGARQFNKLVTTMGIPGITAKTIKRREREIKIPNYDVAKDSCLRVIEEEIECMSKSIPQEEAATPEGLKS
ncbi:Hypothetical predicted protein [Mytilus galloprovincialis]|uniref:Mutator-like transposase domain-containing protein n=1 Tax=Mytilus galloprovincialis TaxID=29158 RepID=A0A8B6DRZ2_MYTGA|nr:Hypothetical predicted protein [Mytilus galloprovincialis]